MSTTLTLYKAYKAERGIDGSQYWQSATMALHAARTRAEWSGLVRIRAIADDDGSSVLDF